MTESRIPDFTSVPLVDLWSLTGKVAIITGGGSGMGQATAVRFAEAGAAVVVVDIAPAGSAETLELIAQQTPDAAAGHAIQVDITDPQQVRALGDVVAQRYGGIDVWVNTAFITTSSSIVDYPDELWREGIAINLDGAFYCAREAARHMAAGDPRGSSSWSPRAAPTTAARVATSTSRPSTAPSVWYAASPSSSGLSASELSPSRRPPPTRRVSGVRGRALAARSPARTPRRPPGSSR
jgi:NAD(P)-dependent dehydrogenase (short-subunit alcohol dehydrogenase family)